MSSFFTFVVFSCFARPSFGATASTTRLPTGAPTRLVTSGAEVFSLARDSELASDEYLDSFFDTGTERQSSWTG